LDGVHAGQVHSLDKLPTTLGRHPKNTIRVDDPSISRFHATLTRAGTRYLLEDLGSRNGSFAVSAEGTGFELEDGEAFKLGPRVSFRFALVDSDEEKLLTRLHESSTRDALTGAYNRKHFNDRLNAELAYAQRHKTNVALILMDIDHFKNVNDTLGHPAGDAILRNVASTLQARLRTEDVFARFGGEEFAILLRGVHLSGASKLAERLRAIVAKTPAIWQGNSVAVTLSAGCAALSCTDRPCEAALLEIADRRLYVAKDQGRNRVISRD
jgi:diguanylate cyclase (GGDEF)-like protein